jgi:hypothetical protein
MVANWAWHGSAYGMGDFGNNGYIRPDERVLQVSSAHEHTTHEHTTHEHTTHEHTTHEHITHEHTTAPSPPP